MTADRRESGAARAPSKIRRLDPRAKSGTQTIQNELLIRTGLPLVEIAARRLFRRLGQRVEVDELISIGRSALVDIAAKFDEKRGRFEGFALQRLTWAMLDAVRTASQGTLRSRARALAASKRFGEGFAAEAAEGETPDSLPTEEELQKRLNDLLEGHAAALAIGIFTAHNDVERARDERESPEEGVLRTETSEVLRQAVLELPERERTLVERHYYREERFDVIADDLGISKAWASRLHALAIRKLAKRLRGSLGPDDFDEAS